MSVPQVSFDSSKLASPLSLDCMCSMFLGTGALTPLTASFLNFVFQGQLSALSDYRPPCETTTRRKTQHSLCKATSMLACVSRGRMQGSLFTLSFVRPEESIRHSDTHCTELSYSMIPYVPLVRGHSPKFKIPPDSSRVRCLVGKLAISAEYWGAPGLLAIFSRSEW